MVLILPLFIRWCLRQNLHLVRCRLPVDRQSSPAFGRWLAVCQPVDGNGKADNVNRRILDELGGGATGVYLSLGPVSVPDLEQMLHDVVLGAADMIIDAGPHIGDVIAAFDTISLGQHKTLSEIALDLAIDPFAPQSDVAAAGRWAACAWPH